MYKEFVLFVAAFLAAASGFHTFTKPGEELVYDYTAIVKMGALRPEHFTSEFKLHGKLHMQSTGNSTVVYLSDLAYTLMNGKNFDEKRNLRPVPVEQQMSVALAKPFKVVHDAAGKVVGISTTSEEDEYSVSMKKSVASMVQLDVSKMLLDGKQHAFVTEEQTIHGKVDVLYNVVPEGDGFVVLKTFETPKHHADHHVVTNTQKTVCDVKIEAPYTQHSDRSYVIKQKSGQMVVTEVKSHGVITPTVFRGHGSFYVHTNQKMELLEKKPIQRTAEVESEHFVNNIVHKIQNLEYSPGWKGTFSKQDLKQEVVRVMNKAVDYLHENHVHMDQPDLMNGQLLNRLKSMLAMCDSDLLQEIHDVLKQKTSERDMEVMELFHHLLPLIGTRAALKHIKQLVVGKQVKEDTIVEMLQVMPLHVILPTQEVVRDMEVLLNLDGSWKVKKAGVLSFSILVNKAYKYERSVVHHDEDVEHTHEHDMHVHGDDTSVYDKYVHTVVSSLRATNDFAKQKLYLEALFNMRIKSIYVYLQPALEGKWWDDEDFRLRCLWAVTPLFFDQPDKVFNWYWPILSDNTKSIDHRVEALYAIMNSHPTTTHLTNIYFLMLKETDKELYQVFYTYVQSIMHTSDPCKELYRERVVKVFNRLPRLDKRSISGFHAADYHDVEFGYGGALSSLILSTNTTKFIHHSLRSHVFNPPSYKYGFWMKIKGLESGLADRFLLNTQSTSKLTNWQDVMKVITSIPNNRHIRIEGSVTKESYIVDGFFYDGSNVNELSSLFDLFNAERHSYIKKGIEVDFDPDTKIFLNTEVGIPAVLEFVMPTVQKYAVNITKESSDRVMNLNFDFHWKMWAHGSYGVSLFNPVVRVKQRVRKYMIFDAELPVHLDVSVSVQQQKMKLTWKVPTQQEGNVIGLRSFSVPAVTTMDYVGEHILQRSASTDKNIVYVTRDEDYKHNYTIMNKHDVNTGYNYVISVYDTDPENYVTNGSFTHKLQNILLETPETHTTAFGFLVNGARHVLGSVLFQPSTVGARGIIIKASPSVEIPVTHIDLSLRANQEVQRDENLFTPKVSFNARATYSVKNVDKATRTWDVNTNVDLNSGHTNNNIKVQVTRIVPGQNDFKMCLDGTVKYGVDNITGHWNLGMGQTTEGKCGAEETVLDVTMVGRKNEEQLRDHHIYGVCSDIPHLFTTDYTLQCIAAHTTVRDYVYDIKTTNVPSEFKKVALLLVDEVKGAFMPHYTRISEHEEDVKENDLRIKVNVPVIGHQMNVEIISHTEGWKLESVPTLSVPLIEKPKSTHVSTLFSFMHAVGLMDVCEIRQDVVRHHHHTVQKRVPDTWELYWGDKIQNPAVAIYVRKVGNKLAMKLVHKVHVLEIHPDVGKPKILLNGQEVSHHHYLLDDWMSFVVMEKTIDYSLGPVYVVVPDTGLLVKYDSHIVKMEVPKFDVHFKGHCADRV